MSSAPDKPTNVVVAGSLNVDYIATMERLPAPGETVPAHGLIKRFGGKGANQAVAAARQGAQVTLIGCVGDDADGAAYRDHLTREGIGHSHVSRTGDAPTGTALIGVDASAENLIIVVAGANGAVAPDLIRQAEATLDTAGALVLQLEIPQPAVLEAMRLAENRGVPIVFNPSPFDPAFPWGEVPIGYLIVNESESAALFGQTPDTLLQDPTPWLSWMNTHRIGALIITRGARSTLLLTAASDSGAEEIPTLEVQPVDTVGAGDAFTGTLATAIASGLPLREALRRANAAGALATLQPGAQEAMPSAKALEAVLP